MVKNLNNYYKLIYQLWNTAKASITLRTVKNKFRKLNRSLNNLHSD